MLSYGLTWPALATLFILPWYESVLGVEGHGQQHWLWPQVGGSDAAHHAAGTLHVAWLFRHAVVPCICFLLQRNIFYLCLCICRCVCVHVWVSGGARRGRSISRSWTHRLLGSHLGWVLGTEIIKHFSPLSNLSLPASIFLNEKFH